MGIKSKSVQFSHSVVSNSLRPHEPQHARLLCPSPTPGVYPNPSPKSVMPSNHLILCSPLFLLPSIMMQSSAYLRLLLFLPELLSLAYASSSPAGSPCCPRDSQESSLKPQFESINSLALSLLYGPTLTSIHDYCMQVV